MSKHKGGLEVQGNLQANIIYLKYVSPNLDTKDDLRTLNGVSQICLTGAATKGGGDWANISEFVKVDQTLEQTFINGNPKINRTIAEVSDDPKNIATVEFVNMATQSLHLDEYFATTASDIGGIYKVMTETPAVAGTVVSATITSNTTTNIFNFATVVDSPHLDRLLAGNYDIHAHLYKTGNRGITCYCELYVRSGVTETLVGTSSLTPSLTATETFYDLYINIPTEIPLLTSDRLVLKWYAISVNPVGNTTVTMPVGGTADPHISIDVAGTELDRIFAYKELTNVDISGLTEETTPDDDDILLLQKDSDGSIKKIKKSNIGGGGHVFIDSGDNIIPTEPNAKFSDDFVLTDVPLSAQTLIELARILVLGNIGYESEYDNGNSGSASTIDFVTNGKNQKVTLTANWSPTFTEPSASVTAHFQLRVIVGGTGLYSITFPANCKQQNGAFNYATGAAGAEIYINFYWNGTQFIVLNTAFA